MAACNRQFARPRRTGQFVAHKSAVIACKLEEALMSSSKLLYAFAISSIVEDIASATLGDIPAHAQTKPEDNSKMPWRNKALSPDERADMVLSQMTLDEKMQMVH